MMKQFYKFLALLVVLCLATTIGHARLWSYSSRVTEPTSIDVSKYYALHAGYSYNQGTRVFLAGNKFLDGTLLSEAFLYKFVPTGEYTADQQPVYYLQRKNGDYVAKVDTAGFYTSDVEQAWKMVIQKANYKDPSYSYNYTWQVEDSTGNSSEVPQTYWGVTAYYMEASANNNPEFYDFSSLTVFNIEKGLVISSYEPDKSHILRDGHTFLLNYPSDESSITAAKGSHHHRNTWAIYPAEETTARESLATIFHKYFPNGDIEAKLGNYSLGNGAGQYDSKKYDIIIELSLRAQEIIENNANATDEEMDRLATEIPLAFEDFVTSGKPITEGYYIFCSMRSNSNIFPSTQYTYPYGRNSVGYDDGALFDGAAINETDTNLRWSYMKNDAVEFYRDRLEGNYEDYLKFVWEVNAIHYTSTCGHLARRAANHHTRSNAGEWFGAYIGRSHPQRQ